MLIFLVVLSIILIISAITIIGTKKIRLNKKNETLRIKKHLYSLILENLVHVENILLPHEFQFQPAQRLDLFRCYKQISNLIETDLKQTEICLNELNEKVINYFNSNDNLEKSKIKQMQELKYNYKNLKFAFLIYFRSL